MSRPDAASSRTPRTAPRVRRAAIALLVALALAPALGLPAVAAASQPASTPTPGAGPLWALPEGGDLLSAFGRSDYNEQDGTPQQVASPDAPSRQALQFTLGGGDERTELEPKIPQQREGQVQYYSYVARLADDFPTDVNTWQVLLQWHHLGSSGSPPIALEVRGNRLMLAAEGEDLQDLGPIRPGDQVDVTMRVLFSQDPSRGAVDVWRGSDHVMRAYRPEGGTMLDEGNYLKVGLYRDDSIDEEGRLWLEDLRVGPTIESVRSPATSSTAAPVEDGTTASPTSSSSSTSDTLTWVAGGLLVLVVLGAVFSLGRRFARR
ncbi:heparin lyase I family protein [Actinomycetospora straminea]|uniref:Polysaccharide lyase-like protein n=1 Tax=Actinomycetospora straminea TaxID=663607 RepID=A0ABP9DZS2_9PSEU|nr:heparin lyase I family protein [Actinomycetospora straminea]MDD7931134.1 heparin lyase I family protein [Actinomycetospora straminea]